MAFELHSQCAPSRGRSDCARGGCRAGPPCPRSLVKRTLERALVVVGAVATLAPCGGSDDEPSARVQPDASSDAHWEAGADGAQGGSSGGIRRDSGADGDAADGTLEG